MNPDYVQFVQANSPVEGNVDALERGKILYWPEARFDLKPEEERFLSPACLASGSKNVSFDPATESLGGSGGQAADRAELQAMLKRFSTFTHALIDHCFPLYRQALRLGRTSFRPVEISGRATSWRKDDTRLHVDAFPSRPIAGNRIFRVFANVNPSAPRLWRAGEPFEDAARRFLPQLKPPTPGSLRVLHLLRVTKTRRTLYDHYMLGLHDAMKADVKYQKEAPQADIAFEPGSVWACYTDCVSHAAMAGQHAFEQTFYLPVTAMRHPALSPLRTLERLLIRELV